LQTAKDANSYYQYRNIDWHEARVSCTRKKKKCIPDHFDDDEVDSPTAMADTPFSADLQRVQQCQIDGLGDGIRERGSGERYRKVQFQYIFAIEVCVDWFPLSV
jgi:hypothetical protein